MSKLIKKLSDIQTYLLDLLVEFKLAKWLRLKNKTGISPMAIPVFIED